MSGEPRSQGLFPRRICQLAVRAAHCAHQHSAE
jgi:hypothetical protein